MKPGKLFYIVLALGLITSAVMAYITDYYSDGDLDKQELVLIFGGILFLVAIAEVIAGLLLLAFVLSVPWRKAFLLAGGISALVGFVIVFISTRFQ